MPRVQIPEGSGITDTFTFTCNVCGGVVDVAEGKEQPHRCRIEIPERVTA